jgi:4-amino-4-deoxy-L-arabinose transferase-like glycosyltransferase
MRINYSFACVGVALLLALCVGVLGRGFWTPDEPREADIAWRMSWQPAKAVPLLAGEAFCEKPPLAYWVAGAAIRGFGMDAWAARLPNLLYALITALAVGLLAGRSAGSVAGLAAAAAISTFLLSYQVAIWLATDAPLLAAVAVSLLGLYTGFYANRPGQRLRGYSCMHAALALGFLSKSAAAWMVPVLTIGVLVVWERRWRELLRWELYLGLGIQAALILTWVGFVYAGPDGIAHLKVFFWNNLVGRFAHVDAPEELQYAGAHRNTPGKYLIELPIYLWPWTLLVLAAARRAWRQRHSSADEQRPVRFAIATFVPTLCVLSVAATARNIYLAPALPGLALLVGWWARESFKTYDRWDRRAMRGTAMLLVMAILVLALAVLILGRDSWETLNSPLSFGVLSCLGLLASAALAVTAWRAAGRGQLRRGLLALLVAYCALLVGPASQIYGPVDGWQNLGVIGRAIQRDSVGRPLILFAPDETTRAFVDMYARPAVALIPGPISPAAVDALKARLAREPRSMVVTQLPVLRDSRTVREFAARLGLEPLARPPIPAAALPPWVAEAGLHMDRLYAQPNGRRYALLAVGTATTSR